LSTVVPDDLTIEPFEAWTIAGSRCEFVQCQWSNLFFIRDVNSHWECPDQVVDALGDDVAGYDRDGLRAVAHLGGKSGMKKFVQSKGEYNPADELGTSLQSYYDKFAQRGDA